MIRVFIAGATGWAGSALSKAVAASDKLQLVGALSSGLSNDDYAEIEQASNKINASVLAVGNFSITVVLLQKFAEMAAKYISDFEIIDYAQEEKIDSPSGTARELAHRLSKVQKPTVHVPDEKLVGDKESRGASLDGVRVHSVRLPGYVIAVETIFGLKDEKLTIRHDAGASATPYVKAPYLV